MHVHVDMVDVAKFKNLGDKQCTCMCLMLLPSNSTMYFCMKMVLLYIYILLTTCTLPFVFSALASITCL